VDFGKARVGLAISDPDRKLAFPLVTYHRRGPGQDADYFRSLVAAEEVSALVIGLPVHLDGTEGEAARQARAFGTWLSTTTGLPAVYWDERFTSVEAESALWAAGLTHKKRKQRRDKVAAQILLQAYLDAGCPSSPQAGPLEGISDQ
jgi:putative Holliday junction resolvase